jgi:outer membrane protein insertion porin family
MSNKLRSCGVSSLKHTISYGTFFLKGLQGSFSTGVSTTFAGLGGNARHMKNEIFSNYVMPISRNSDVRFGVSFGVLSKVGKKKPHIEDSFSLGLESFRGFDDCGFGPFSETKRIISDRVVSSRDYAGAKKYWKGTVEYSFPMGMPPEVGFRGLFLVDIGTCWGAPEKGNNLFKKTGEKVFLNKDGKPTTEKNAVESFEIMTCDFDCGKDNPVIHHRIADSKSIRASVGAGISFITPIGPMKLVYAIPVKKKKYDESYRLLFGFNTTF